MKKSLKESERLSEILMENITEIIAIQDTKHRILKVNRAAGASVGKKPGELVGKACYEIWADRDEPCDECPVEKAIASGTPQKGEMTTPEGKAWLIRAYPIKNEEETVKGAVEIALNITERKRAEEKLKKTEEPFKKLFDANPDAAFLVDRREVFREVNEAACELSGYNREELIGTSIRDAPPFPKHTQETLVEQFQRRLQGEDLSPYTIEIQRKNGEIRYVEVNTKPLEVNGRFIGIIGVARDITERKQLEEKLVTLHTWAQKLNRATTMEKIFEYTLDAMGKTLGFTRAAIQLKQETTLNVKAHRGYESLPEQILKLPLDGPGITVKVANTGKPILIKDVTKHTAYLPATPENKAELAVPITVGGEVIGVLNAESEEVDAFDQEDVRLLETLAAHVGVALRELQEKKQRVSLQRLDELRNQFLAMAGHEINTPLTPIKTNLEMLQRAYFGELSKEQERKIKQTLESVNRLNRLVNDFQQISKLRTKQITVDMQEHQLAHTIEKALAKFSNAIKEEDLMVIKHIEQPLAAVYDEDRIVQVLRNLVENAIDYTEDTIWIHGTAHGGHIQVSVRDNGPGIPEEEQAKIFQPFYRVGDEARSRDTRRFGGTGLGLNICKQIVQAHGGEIRVDSNLGEGSTFTVVLPKRS